MSFVSYSESLIAPAEVRQLVARLRERTTLPFDVLDLDRRHWFSEAADQPLPSFSNADWHRLRLAEGPDLFEVDGCTVYACPLSGNPLGDFPLGELLPAVPRGRFAAVGVQSAGDCSACPPEPLLALMRLACAEMEQDRVAALRQTEIDHLAGQLERTYEEISLLHAVTRNLKVSRSLDEVAALCLDRLPEMSDAAGHCLWIRDPDGGAQFLARGELPFDGPDLDRLLAGWHEGREHRPIVRNHIQATAEGKRFPGLFNLTAAPVSEGQHQFGWIVSVNLPAGREFGSVEASLIGSIATIIGTHVRNRDLYRQHQDLLLCFVKSFVSTLDAKDPYTRGHSERVALIGRRLAEELGQSESDLQTVYLSGLLHDIGKIGIDDRILRKEGPLADDEFDQVKKHPMIGYNILRGMTNLQHVLPGVRSHHENYNGTGYPDRLAGEEIALLARILAVADGFDAMHSDRPYRKGMPLEKIQAILRNGRGTQWDPQVIDAYFRCHEAIATISSTYTLGERCSQEATSEVCVSTGQLPV